MILSLVSVLVNYNNSGIKTKIVFYCMQNILQYFFFMYNSKKRKHTFDTFFTVCNVILKNNINIFFTEVITCILLIINSLII